ncbi:MAG TPA: heme exporter protein CcmD [Geminicoccaceae bacterium]
MSEFFDMGGYGAYVWAAFGFAFVALLGLLLQSIAQARRREREFQRLREVARPAVPEARRPRRAVRAAAPAGEAAGEA